MMRQGWILLVLVMVFASCGQKSDAPPMNCPEGAWAFGKGPPEDFVQMCLKKKGARRVLEGPYRQWYKNGNLQVLGQFLQSKEEGRWVGWYENGARRFVTYYKKGEKHGPDIFYYDNGQVSFKGHYLEGKRHGPLLRFSRDGAHRSKTGFDRGVPAGVWKFWCDNGLLALSLDCDAENARCSLKAASEKATANCKGEESESKSKPLSTQQVKQLPKN